MTRQIGEWFGRPETAELEYRVHRLEERVEELSAAVRALAELSAGRREEPRFEDPEPLRTVEEH